MDFRGIWDTVMVGVGGALPGILAAIAILVVGWIIAVIVRAVLRKGLGFVGLNRRLTAATDSAMNLEGGIAQGGFWIIMLMVLVGAFTRLDLPMVSAPLTSLLDQVLTFLPRIAAGAAIAVVAWVLATVVRTLASKGLAATSLDDKLLGEADMAPPSESIGNVLFWLIVLLFTPAVLGVLGLTGLLAPVQGLVDELLAMLPNIFAGAILVAVGWFLAKILRDLVVNLLNATGAQRLAAKAGIDGSLDLPKLAGMLVFVFVFVPALVAGLNALRIEAISGPAVRMLDTFMTAIPNIFAAIVILTISYFVARFASQALTELTRSAGVDSLPQEMGLTGIADNGVKVSAVLGRAVMVFAMLFATVEAAGQLGFVGVSELVTNLIGLAGQILLGSVILAAGFWLANLAHRALSVGAGASVAGIARFGILGLVLAMGLRAMGIADDIVNLAFGLTLGAIAVAFALSFGLGGREAAGHHMDHWLKNLRGE